MNRIILAIATAAVGSATLIGGAEANTIWRNPYKSTPYAVPHDHAKPLSAKVAPMAAKRHAHS
ncbi:MAG: hypothetical protein WC807_09055 [Hyphomicrobium sp.]|jgi:hypothetical protein|uniref:hypothetical protein n=1 Tax=Hyphomicrobium sp. DMF-1 TaxID=3019544 RepID=UPI000BDA2314|nr:hypothetical protein [Hyphomicrobium sp. DMF-1]MBN8912290.1 hypothetical protein [Hyphomicrobiales bacterium]OYW53713.1 MAG: hypothetical protein B7Z29_14795 [Hyphomicrobium sp. 12-62-95]OYX98444.1 MAG: hypothetical protein B7Y80_15565 [Hyphomicrobium sp. 32-62-53]WBT37973.1 hypothetical protein PE058_20305 [Hyphomicrobium sp. DMF-1]